MWVKTLTRAVMTAQIIVYKLFCVHRSRLKPNVFYATNTRRPGSFRVMRRAVKCAVTRIWRQKQKQATVDREVNS